MRWYSIRLRQTQSWHFLQQSTISWLHHTSWYLIIHYHGAFLRIFLDAFLRIEFSLNDTRLDKVFWFELKMSGSTGFWFFFKLKKICKIIYSQKYHKLYNPCSTLFPLLHFPFTAWNGYTGLSSVFSQLIKFRLR